MDEKKAKEELKKCPFCGGEAEVNYYKSAESWYAECALSKGACATIPCTYPYPTKEEAIEAWNRRVE